MKPGEPNGAGLGYSANTDEPSDVRTDIRDVRSGALDARLKQMGKQRDVYLKELETEYNRVCR
jgi:hypothetical protein